MRIRLALVALVVLISSPALCGPESPALLDRLLELHAKGDEASLTALLREQGNDPWLLVEGLIERDHGEVATTCAKLTEWPKLVAYAKWRASNPPAAEVVKALNAVAEPGVDRKAWLETYAGLVDLGGRGVRYVRLLGRTGQSLQLVGKVDEAVAMYERAARTAIELGWTASALRMYGYAASTTRLAKQHEQALRLVAARVKLAEEADQPAQHCLVLRQAFLECRRMGRISEARAYGAKAVACATTPAESRATLRDLAYYELEIGEVKAGIEHLTALRALEEQAGRMQAVAQCDLQLATAEARLGRFDHVLPRVASAIAYFDEHGTPKNRYLAHISAGKAHLLMRDSERTLHHVQEARKAIDGAHALQDLTLEASALSYLGRVEEAIPVFQRTLELNRGAKPEHRVAACINLVNLFAFAKRPKEAEPYLAEARALLPKVSDPAIHAHAYASASMVYAEDQEWDRAIEAATKASGINGEMLNRELGAANKVMLARCWLQKNDPRRAMGHAADAVDHVLARSAALPARLGAQYRSALRSTFQYAVLAAVRAEDTDSVFRFGEQAAAVALRNRLGAQEVVRYAFPAALRARELELQAAEAKAVAALRTAVRTRNSGKRSAAFASVGAVREQLDRHRERVRAERIAASQVVDPTVDDLASTKKRLAEDQALVMFVRGVHDVFAVRVTRSSAQTVRLGTRKQLSELIDDLVLEDESAPAGDTTTQLRKAIAAPIALPTAVKRLVIVPTGRLAHLPFSVIWPDLSIRLASSTTIDRLIEAREAKAGEGVLAVGDPEGADGRRLPGAREEAQAVGDQVLLGAEATEARLEAAVASRPRWRAVHIACHALIDPKHPLRSALSLSPADGRDGLWTVSEILQSSVQTDLVVLGACSTGRGKTFDQEGALGFVQAFFVAGGKRVLVSLWDVDDKATSALLQRFHAAWKSGVPPARALAAAQKSVRAEKRWAHPAYWAAWQLWGPE